MIRHHLLSCSSLLQLRALLTVIAGIDQIEGLHFVNLGANQVEHYQTVCQLGQDALVVRHYRRPTLLLPTDYERRFLDLEVDVQTQRFAVDEATHTSLR